MRLRSFVYGIALVTALAAGPVNLAAQDKAPPTAGTKKTLYALKKPVFAGACKSCPWGSIAEIEFSAQFKRGGRDRSDEALQNQRAVGCRTRETPGRRNP